MNLAESTIRPDLASAVAEIAVEASLAETNALYVLNHWSDEQVTNVSSGLASLSHPDDKTFVVEFLANSTAYQKLDATPEHVRDACQQVYLVVSRATLVATIYREFGYSQVPGRFVIDVAAEMIAYGVAFKHDLLGDDSSQLVKDMFRGLAVALAAGGFSEKDPQLVASVGGKWELFRDFKNDFIGEGSLTRETCEAILAYGKQASMFDNFF